MGAPAFAAEIARSYNRPEPLRRMAYRAWHQSGREMDTSPAAALSEAIEIAKVGCRHKDCFAVLEVDTFDRRATVHHFRVKKSTKHGSYRRALDNPMHDVFEGNLEAEPLYSQPVTAFAPVAPWQWSQDDPSGFKHGKLTVDSPLLEAL